MAYFQEVDQILGSMPSVKIGLYEGKSAFSRLTKPQCAEKGGQPPGRYPARISGISLLT